MANFTKIPFLNPIKFVPSVTTPGKNFDDDWAYNQIKLWEKRVCWKQKWQYGDETPLIMISTVLPDKLKLYDKNSAIIKDFEWVPILAGGSAGMVYKTTVNIDSFGGGPTTTPTGVYWLYQNVEYGSYHKEFISEPIELRAVHKNTSIVRYKNSENTQDVPFGASDIEFVSRLECQLSEFLPDSDMSDYIDQLHNAQILDGIPFRTWKLLVGNAPGVTDYTVDLMNRIFTLDSVRLNDKLITKVSGAKWEPQRTKGYPLAGWAIEVTETINLSSLELNDLDPVIPGVVVVYDIDEDLFGETSGNNVRVIDTEQT